MFFCILGQLNISFKMCAHCQNLLYHILFFLCFVMVVFFFCLEGHDVRGFEVDIRGVPYITYIYICNIIKVILVRTWWKDKRQ